MTYRDIINYGNVVFDDYHMPFLDDDRAAQLLYDAIVEFVEQAYREAELIERRRQDLIDFVRPVSLAGATNIINLSAIDEFMFVFELGGTFTDPCDSTKTITRPIAPLKLDKHFRSEIDTFEKPDDYYPKYIEYRDGLVNTLEVLSATTAVSYKMFYVRQPNLPTAATLDTTSPEFGAKKPICYEVAKIFARKTMPPAEDFNRYPMEQQEIQLARS